MPAKGNPIGAVRVITGGGSERLGWQMSARGTVTHAPPGTRNSEGLSPSLLDSHVVGPVGPPSTGPNG